MGKKYKARLKQATGGHREGTGLDAVDYKPGDIVESDVNLVGKFPGKFEDPQANAPLEQDVTINWDAAIDNNLCVINRQDRYYVCGSGGSGNELSGALAEEKVEDFIYDYLESLAEEKPETP